MFLTVLRGRTCQGSGQTDFAPRPIRPTGSPIRSPLRAAPPRSSVLETRRKRTGIEGLFTAPRPPHDEHSRLIKEVGQFHRECPRDRIRSVPALHLYFERLEALQAKAAVLLRATEGRRELTLEQIDRLEEAFTGGSTVGRHDLYGSFPAEGPGVHCAIVLEEIDSLARYLDLLGAKEVAEVGAGDGELTSALNRHETIRTKGIRIIASDAGVGNLKLGAHVLKRPALEAVEAQRPDVILVSWVDPSTPLDLKMAEYVQRHPETTLIIIGALSDTGSHQFFARVMGEHHVNQNNPVPSDAPPPTIDIPLQRAKPVGLNAVRGADGKLYSLGRSRRKIAGNVEGSYTLVLRAMEAPPIPDGEPFQLSTYVPYSETRIGPRDLTIS